MPLKLSPKKTLRLNDVIKYHTNFKNSGGATVCMAVGQGSTTGLAGLFHAVCMTSYMSGQTIAGIFSSVARIVSLALGEEPIQSGLIYFAIADVFLVITIMGYIYLIKTVSHTHTH